MLIKDIVCDQLFSNFDDSIYTLTVEKITNVCYEIVLAGNNSTLKFFVDEYDKYLTFEIEFMDKSNLKNLISDIPDHFRSLDNLERKDNKKYINIFEFIDSTTDGEHFNIVKESALLKKKDVLITQLINSYIDLAKRAIKKINLIKKGDS